MLSLEGESFNNVRMGKSQEVVGKNLSFASANKPLQVV